MKILKNFYHKLFSKDQRVMIRFRINMFYELISLGFYSSTNFQEKRPVRTIVVLGMHRSATSMIARSMHLTKEVYMGNDLMLGGQQRGHYEQIPIVQLNDKILEAANGSWDKPPSDKSIQKLKGVFDKEIQNELTKLKQSSPGGTIGFKDPRMCLTVKLWEPFLINPQYVLSFRDSREIALSLQKRNGMSIREGEELANEYNRRIKDFLNDRY